MPIRTHSIVEFNNFVKFCDWQYRIHDHYPHVKTYEWLVMHHRLPLADSIWLCLLYMAYYDDGSGWCAFNEPQVKSRTALPLGKYPISIQRRNLFGGRLSQHLESILAIDSLVSFVGRNWGDLFTNLSSVYGNGRWAAYTTAEMLIRVCQLQYKQDAYEIVDSTGPKRGMFYLGLEATERCAEWLRQTVSSRIGVGIDVEVFESMLCNWSRMHRGKFYLGRNLDRQQKRLLKVERITGQKLTALWQARQKGIPNRCLGELNGWNSIDVARLKVYRDQRKVLLPFEGR